MKMYISREFGFEAAHNLLNYKGKCERLHGHSYRLKVTLVGDPCKDTGMIVDFGNIKQIVEENIINELDHRYLNEIIKQSTAENIIQWIWDILKDKLKGTNYKLYELVLWETENNSITLRDE